MSAAPNLKQTLKLKISVHEGPHVGQSFSFEQNTIKIGRGSENDIVLANDPRASRHHAEIRLENGEFHAYNVSQKNYVAVNGDTVDSAKLSPGDKVSVGETEFRVEFDKPADAEEFSPAPMAAQQVTKLHQVGPGPILQPTSSAAVPAPAATPNFPPMPQRSNPAPAPLYSQPPASNYTLHSGPSGTRRGSSSAAKSSMTSNSRARFYGLVLIIGALAFWLLSSNHAKKKDLSFRSSEQVEKDLEVSREEMKVLEERREKINTIQYKRAQENFIRGFRDYKQGNFARAREAFQVVLNLDPDNPLALRYYNLAKVKFDEMVKFHMLQGNRYREKKNWHMCSSSYFNVMTMLNNPQDPLFKEAKQYYDQCTIEQEGNF